APEAELLIDFGLTEGPNRVHKGQGTQNRCFFFNNTMLELLWVYDESDAQNDSTTPTTLWPRWSQRKSDVCSFGLCVRAVDKTKNEAPFNSWKYQPDLFPEGMFVKIADSVNNLKEPLIFYSPMGHRPDSGNYANEKMRQHKINFKELTSISLGQPQENYSDAFEALINHNIIKLNPNLNSKIELQFDKGVKKMEKDFSPMLPLVIKW
ncbi:MAG: hypothetical protein ACC653_11245, partial [Gammaproteobacteria bacterium]